MPLLTDYPWRAHYSPDNTGSLVAAFYIPALRCAVRYWRSSGYFQASALALAARGLESLVANAGTMRLLVGCTLQPPEIAAIQRGLSLRQQVAEHLSAPLEPPDAAARDALELLAWLVQHDFLEIKVAVPCDSQRQPLSNPALFHAKTGLVEDAAGNRLAFSGSLNETASGWQRNWESFHVFTSWQTPEHVNEEEQQFADLWNGDRSPRALILEIPDAVRQGLLSFAPPAGQLPRRLQDTNQPYRVSLPPPPPEPAPELPREPRQIVWDYLAHAPKSAPGGDRVGEATCAVTPWPHQIRAFQRLWQAWPPRLLIADEVGLGKTIQAGLLLRQAWLSDRARRILVMVPAAVLQQWQLELREKFNLNWPIYDGKALNWYPARGFPGPVSRPVSRDQWHAEPCVLVSSHLMRRRDRAAELLEQAEPWDLLVVDEAHHARRRGSLESASKGRQEPNRLLALLQRLKSRVKGLVLLTATPMQVDPLEVWDLLQLLGLPPDWTAQDFLRFFELANQAAPSNADLAYLARLFRAVESHYQPIADDLAQRYAPGQKHLKARKFLRALRDPKSNLQLKQLNAEERRAALRIMLAHTPVRVLISRHTRELLRAYHRSGKLATRVADRQVEDVAIELANAEREVYDAVEDYISQTYNNAAAGDRNAVGFVMTIYRKRLASSFAALARTLEKRLAKLAGQGGGDLFLEEDVADQEASGEAPDSEEANSLERAALQLEEASELKRLLVMVRALPVDTKTETLKRLLVQLRAAGYTQAIVFTQFTDTLDFLREEIARSLELAVMCFSGRGGEVANRDGSWQAIDREETKRRFRDRQADILLCTDAAAEGLNFQFCGALVNYDLPWNPMRVEQRIGRIDRLGQVYDTIRIYNLQYQNTIETDVYAVLKERIGFFQTIVGRLQPILSRLPGAIANLTLASKEVRERDRQALLDSIQQMAADSAGGFDLDQITEADLDLPERAAPAYTLADLQPILEQPELLPPGVAVHRSGDKDFSYVQPGLSQPVRVTLDPDFYDRHSDSVELWSPGSPLFPPLKPASDEPPSRPEFVAACQLRAMSGRRDPSSASHPAIVEQK